MERAKVKVFVVVLFLERKPDHIRVNIAQLCLIQVLGEFSAGDLDCIFLSGKSYHIPPTSRATSPAESSLTTSRWLEYFVTH